MACFTGERRRRVDEAEEKPAIGGRIVGCFGLILVIFLFPLIGLIVAMISRFGFEQSWGAALFHGFVAYLIVKGISALAGLGEVFEDSAIEEKKRAVRKRWQEKFGNRRRDEKEG